jgi:hypothetical protein
LTRALLERFVEKLDTLSYIPCVEQGDHGPTSISAIVINAKKDYNKERYKYRAFYKDKNKGIPE